MLLLGCGTSTQKLAHNSPYLYDSGAVVRGDTTQKKLALVFKGDEFADGGNHIAGVLEKLQKLLEHGHYLGAHSDQHLLYCDWQKRDSLLVSREEFQQDLLANYQAMESFGLRAKDAPLFLPPFEWHNDTIASWTRSMGFQLINLTRGTLSHADLRTPKMIYLTVY